MRIFVKLSSSLVVSSYLFHDGGRYHIETSPQWTGFYMITAYVMKELKVFTLISDKLNKKKEYW